MQHKIPVFCLLGLSLVFSCKTSESVMKTAWPHGVKYEIFPLAFADESGDGKGDLKGITEKLEYVQELGVNGIWLMPIMPSPSYHKYDVADYKNIHPDYGTLEDFRRLTEEAHKRGIHVIIDLVLNHTAVLGLLRKKVVSKMKSWVLKVMTKMASKSYATSTK